MEGIGIYKRQSARLLQQKYGGKGITFLDNRDFGIVQRKLIDVIQREDDSLEEEEYDAHEGEESAETTETRRIASKKDDDPYWIRELISSGADARQLARQPNAWSGPKNLLNHRNVCYFRDGGGNIDFGNAQYGTTSANHPTVGRSFIGPYQVKLGKVTSTKNRTEHFLKANKIVNAKYHHAHFPNRGVSPDGYTWHHLSSRYDMILINREAHKRFGHNGGVYLW